MAGQETEVKFSIHDRTRLEDALRQVRAELIQERVEEINLRFDTPDRILQRSFRVLRLRQDRRAWITYKGPGHEKEGVLSREEVETEIADFETARHLLIALGYEIVFIYEKFRTVYALAEVKVMLDELPFGNFVEIEGDPSGIRRAADQLHLNWQAAIPASYHTLFQQLAAERKLPFRDLTFKNFQERQLDIGELGIQAADDPPQLRR